MRNTRSMAWVRCIRPNGRTLTRSCTNNWRGNISKKSNRSKWKITIWEKTFTSHLHNSVTITFNHDNLGPNRSKSRTMSEWAILKRSKGYFCQDAASWYRRSASTAPSDRALATPKSGGCKACWNQNRVQAGLKNSWLCLMEEYLAASSSIIRWWSRPRISFSHSGG